MSKTKSINDMNRNLSQINIHDLDRVSTAPYDQEHKRIESSQIREDTGPTIPRRSKTGYTSSKVKKYHLKNDKELELQTQFHNLSINQPSCITPENLDKLKQTTNLEIFEKTLDFSIEDITREKEDFHLLINKRNKNKTRSSHVYGTFETDKRTDREFAKFENEGFALSEAKTYATLHDEDTNDDGLIRSMTVVGEDAAKNFIQTKRSSKKRISRKSSKEPTSEQRNTSQMTNNDTTWQDLSKKFPKVKLGIHKNLSSFANKDIRESEEPISPVLPEHMYTQSLDRRTIVQDLLPLERQCSVNSTSSSTLSKLGKVTPGRLSFKKRPKEDIPMHSLENLDSDQKHQPLRNQKSTTHPLNLLQQAVSGSIAHNNCSGYDSTASSVSLSSADASTLSQAASTACTPINNQKPKLVRNRSKSAYGEPSYLPSIIQGFSNHLSAAIEKSKGRDSLNKDDRKVKTSQKQKPANIKAQEQDNVKNVLSQTLSEFIDDNTTIASSCYFNTHNKDGASASSAYDSLQISSNISDDEIEHDNSTLLVHTGMTLKRPKSGKIDKNQSYKNTPAKCIEHIHEHNSSASEDLGFENIESEKSNAVNSSRPLRQETIREKTPHVLQKEKLARTIAVSQEIVQSRETSPKVSNRPVSRKESSRLTVKISRSASAAKELVPRVSPRTPVQKPKQGGVGMMKWKGTNKDKKK